MVVVSGGGLGVQKDYIGLNLRGVQPILVYFRVFDIAGRLGSFAISDSKVQRLISSCFLRWKKSRLILAMHSHLHCVSRRAQNLLIKVYLFKNCDELIQ